MEEERIKTTENFIKLLPFSGGSIACEDTPEVGLVYHLNIKLPAGGYIILTVPETTAQNYPEYFKISKE